MTKEKIYEQLKHCLCLAWQDDDLMTQENLFALQEKLANLTLAVAESIGDSALKDLCFKFPFLYSMK